MNDYNEMTGGELKYPYVYMWQFSLGRNHTANLVVQPCSMGPHSLNNNEAILSVKDIPETEQHTAFPPKRH